MTEKIGFGVINDRDESLKSKTAGSVKFGLNEGYITKLEYNPNGGKDGMEQDAVDITFQVGEREMMRRIFDVNKVFGKDGEITDTESEEYINEYNKAMKQNMAVIIHALKAVGVTQEQLQQALATPPDSFGGWAQIVTSLVPNDFASKPVDAFLEYEWSIRSGQDRTYLQLPKNMKGGYFLCPHVEPNGSWTEQKEWEENVEGKTVKMRGLRYVDDNNQVHPFKRSEAYMGSNKANQQVNGPQISMETTSSTSTW